MKETQRKRRMFAQIIFIALLPILFFPLITSLSLLANWLLGSGENIVSIIYGPKTEILDQYINDWISSILLSAIVIWIFFTPLYIFFKRKNIAVIINPVVTSTLIWLLAGIYLYHFNIVGIILSGFTGLMFAIALLGLQYLFKNNRRTS